MNPQQQFHEEVTAELAFIRNLLVEKNQARQLDTWNTGDSLGMTGKNGAWKKHGPRPRAGAGDPAGRYHPPAGHLLRQIHL